jgi:tricorn protease
MKYSFALCVLWISMLSFAQGTQLLRQPTLFGDEVVFVYANDLWKTTVTGGTAIRLTSDEGYESALIFQMMVR